MKLILSIIFTWIPSSLALANCHEPEIWPKLTHWICTIADAMDEKDRGKDYHRSIHLITDHDDIKQMRRDMNAEDTQICRLFTATTLGDGLGRITVHQGFPVSFNLEIRDQAAKELHILAGRDRFTICEGDVLTESQGEDPHKFTRYYYLKLGPEREYKNLMIQVTTRWRL